MMRPLVCVCGLCGAVLGGDAAAPPAHHRMELNEADVVQIWVVTDCNYNVDFGPEGVVKIF